MEDDQNGPVICFWSSMKASEAHEIARKAALGLKWFLTANSPGGAITLAMGGERLRALQTRLVCPKNRTIESMRGTLLQTATGPMLVTYDTGLRHVRADAISQIVWDARLAERYAKTGTVKPPKQNYQWADDLCEFIDQVIQKYLVTGKPVDISVDTETMGLFPWYPDKEILTLQASHEPGTGIAVYVRGLQSIAMKQFLVQLQWLLTTPKVRIRGANFKYDLIWIWKKWGLECTNFTMDTTVVGSLLDENRSNGLNWHAKEHSDIGGYDDEFNAKHDKAHMETVPKGDLLPYAAGDVDACLQVATYFKKRLAVERSSQHLYVKLIHPALRAFEKVERRGMLVDRGKMQVLRADLVKFIAEKEQALVSMLSTRMRMKHQEKINDQLMEGKSPLTSTILSEHFFCQHYGMGLKPKLLTEKSQKPSTAHEHLVMFHDEPAVANFVDIYKEVSGARKTLSTYVDGFMSDLRPDGRWHPTYMLYNGDMFGDGDVEGGTNTGRLSAKNPAVQTIPKRTRWAKRLRECIIAPEGHVIWQRDFSQGELRIAACEANEPTMIDAYLNNKDLHGITGAKFAAMLVQEFLAMQHAPEGSEAEACYAKYRQRGKNANFGMIYKISAGGFQVYCRRNGLNLTQEECEDYLKAFFALYGGLHPWHQKQIAFAKKHGFVVSPLGRIRHLPLIDSTDGFTRSKEERRAINSPIQSTLSDLCAWSIVKIEEALGEEACVVGMTHDSCYGYVREDQAKEIVPQIGQIMVELPYTRDFGWEPALTFPTDAEAGPNMAAMVKLK